MRLEMASINYILLLAFAIIMGSVQIVLSYAAHEIKLFIPYKGIIFGILSSGWLLLGLLLYFIASIFWIYMLSRVDIRLAYPLASTAVVFASLFQSIIDGVYPPTTYWIGLFAVIVGLVLINYR